MSLEDEVKRIQNKDNAETYNPAIASLEALQILIAGGGGGGGPTDWDTVYFDPANGNTLAHGNDGTPTKPLNNEADVLTQIANKKLSKVKIVESEGTGSPTFTSPSDITGVSFWGDSSESCNFNPNGKNFNHCDFHYLYLQNANGASGFSTAYDCNVYLTDNNGWDYYHCVIWNPLNVILGSLPSFYDCIFTNTTINIKVGSSTAIIVLNGQGTVISVYPFLQFVISCDIKYGVPTSGTLTGAQTAAPSATVMTDAAATFIPGALVGLTILNTTDGSSGVITANTATTITCAGGLSGGSDNTFETNDAYSVTVPVVIVDQTDSTGNLITGLTLAAGQEPNFYKCTFDNNGSPALITWPDGTHIELQGTGDVLITNRVQKSIIISGNIKYGVPSSAAITVTITGTQTAAPSLTVMTDAAASFTPGALVDLIIYDQSDIGSHGTITANTATTITCAGGLSGGIDNQWLTGAIYAVTIPALVIDQTDAQYDGIWVRHDIGDTGTGPGFGTPQNPVGIIGDVLSGDLTDAITIALAKKLNKLYLVKGSGLGNSYSLHQDIDGLSLWGSDGGYYSITLDINGHNARVCDFHHLGVSGFVGSYLSSDFIDCYIDNFKDTYSANYYNCTIVAFGDATHVGAYPVMFGCKFEDSDVYTDGAEIVGAEGILTIHSNTSQPTVITAKGLILTIDLATCTGGSISVYGDAKILYLPGAGGVTVNDYTIQSNQVKTASTTIDLNPVGGAGTYDLFTGTAGAVELNSLIITMPNAAADGALTSISIQTNDATPQVLIDSTTGGVLNLAAEAQLAWQGRVRLGVGKKIQLTINGGAEGGAYVCNVDVEFKSLASAGYLA